jgi:tight adherence protein C
MSALLAAGSGLLAFTAAWELAGMGRIRALEPLLRRLRRGSARVAGPELAARLVRAGVDGRFGAREVGLARLAGGALGSVAALASLPVAPPRLFPPLAVLMVAAGLLAPDAALERRARRRAAEVVAALPDALDLLAVGVGAGRSPGAMAGELAARSSGALALELARVAAEIETGATEARAMGALRDRLRIAEVGALVATLERSRRYGSPLADQLHSRAVALRADERRRLEEVAARAAPKIQLAVALLIVPSALLAIAAALVANADAFLGTLAG